MKTIIYLFVSLFLSSCVDYNFSSPKEENKTVDDSSKNDTDMIIYNQLGAPYRNDGFRADFNKWGKHEGLLPIIDVDWSNGSRPGQWMSPNGQKAISAWGQIVEEKGGSPIKNVTFHISNHKMYIYSNARWILAENVISKIEFGVFSSLAFKFDHLLDPNSFQKNDNVVSIPYQSSQFLHWFSKQSPANRFLLPNSFDAIFITCEMKLSTSANYDMNNVRFLGAVGADYYAEYNTISDGNLGLVMPRHKYLTTEWKTFTAYIAGASFPTSELNFKAEIKKRPLPPLH